MKQTTLQLRIQQYSADKQFGQIAITQNGVTIRVTLSPKIINGTRMVGWASDWIQLVRWADDPSIPHITTLFLGRETMGETAVLIAV